MVSSSHDSIGFFLVCMFLPVKNRYKLMKIEINSVKTRNAHDLLQHGARLFWGHTFCSQFSDPDFSQTIEKEKMNIKALHFVLSVFTLVDGSLLLRTQVATGSEFGRVVRRVLAPKEEAKR